MTTVREAAFRIKTNGFSDVQNITPQIEEFLERFPIASGIVTLFVPGSTAGITTIEFEPGAIADLKKAIERLAPQNVHYDHDARWGDGNGFSHVRAALLGPSLVIPISRRQLQLGTWQQVVLVDFDNRPRTRDIVVQFIGE